MVPIPPAQDVPTAIQDYTVIQLRCPPVSSYSKPTTHFLYLRPNAPKVPTPTTPRELFLVNTPIDSTTQHIRSLFAEQLGGARVESVDFEDSNAPRKPNAPVAGKKRKRGGGGGSKTLQQSSEDVGRLPETWDRELHRSGSTAIVTFVDTSSSELAMKEARKVARAGKRLHWGQGLDGKVPELGVARYVAHHKLRYPPAQELQSSVDAFMTAFANKEAERAKLLARQRQEPDEDGFITVTRGGRVGPARLEEAQEKAEKQKEKHKGKEDFYRFQMREKKKEKAGDLMRGFEEDRRKVEEMKMRRNKFRPV